MAEDKKTILLVEDERPLLRVLADTFRQEGFDVLEALNGKLGLQAAVKKKPDVILLDIIMPVMDGLTMLQELRQDPWGKNATVILLTNLSDFERISKALEYGVYDYLVKTDWKMEDVVKKVKEKFQAPLKA